MSESFSRQPTLSTFFEISRGGPAELFDRASSDELGDLRARLARDLKGLIDPKAFLRLAFQELSELLDVEMPALLVRGWKKTNEIRAYADPEKHPFGETHLVPLVEHKLKSSHKPALKPTLNEVELVELEFAVDLGLEIKGAALRIRDGLIRGLETGECRGAGSIKLEDVPLIEKKTRRFDLPGTVDFGEGVEIPFRKKDQPSDSDSGPPPESG